ncbi:hypothetical protein ACFE04_013062 [Oxalis oulophora]
MPQSLFLCLLLLLLLLQPNHFFFIEAAGGQWELLQKSVGVSALHMQVLPNDRVILFDRTDFGESKLDLPNGKCRENPKDLALKKDCTAHSVEYDVSSNTYRPLMVQTDLWCSSGSLMPDGHLCQTGGYNDGIRRIRNFYPCNNGDCDWDDREDGLAVERWYSTNHILPDGRQIIVGGRRQYNYEFYPHKGAAQTNDLPFLKETFERSIENNLYPFVFLHPSGNVFIFANNRAILLDYTNNKVVKNYPAMPDGNHRSYPSTGSAVLLPLKNLQGDFVDAEVLICGGAPQGAYLSAKRKNFVEALDTCGRIKITDVNPNWVMEKMPMPRVMGDMKMLPNGDVLIINGAGSGTAGWELGRDPVFHPVLYHTDNKIGKRFEVMNPNKTPRLYHSTAVLLTDASILVAGSNPHFGYELSSKVQFPTDLSMERYSPPYLDEQFGEIRPYIIFPKSQVKVKYGQKLMIQFVVEGNFNENMVEVTMIAPAFTTHSFSMNQRMLVVGGEKVAIIEKPNKYEVEAITPPNKNLAPPGYYQLFVVHKDIPSTGIWVHLN